MSATPLKLLARGTFLALALFSATYCLLAYLPFTYQAVLKFNMVSWLPAFLRWHPALFLAAALANALVDGRSRGLRRAFHGLVLLAAVGLLLRPLLPRLENTLASFGYTVAFAGAALALLLLDLSDLRGRLPARLADTDQGHRLLRAALPTAAFLAGLFLLIAASKGGHGLVPALWSLSAHLLAVLMVAVALLALQGLARASRPDPFRELVITGLAASAAAAVALHQIAFTALSFSGPLAILLALLLALVLVAALAVLGLELPLPPEGPASALDLLFRPLAFLRAAPAWLVAAWLIGLGLAGWAVETRAATFDWNYLFQKLVAAALALVAFAGFHALAARDGAPRRSSNRLFLATLGALATFKLLPLALPADAEARLDKHAGLDPEVLLLRDALRPVAQAGASIYRVLQRNSNIPQDVRTDPVDVKLADLKPGSGPRPNIFILVVDSLRQDYVGAFNPKVAFTPAMDRFAKEGVALPAFSRYGATGLSEPSLWVGGMILHKQYVTPFRPMNSLQKLLEAEGYQALVAMDNVLDVVVTPWKGMEELTPGVGTQDLRMEGVVQALRSRLDRRGADPRPLFAYAQVQDLHVSVINREGKDVPGGGDYPGFYAPYAARVRRIDAAFGAFIEGLKARGLYDNSLVILTADHGDSLGEEGRFGHAYTLYPEILRIPLLIHLPEAMKAKVVTDPGRPTLLTDVTPSLYYLLGHRPLAQDPILGRPIFTETPQEQEALRQDHFLLASSYGAVYGILGGDGRSLYVSDAVNLRDYYYDLGWDPKGTRNALTPARKARHDALILQDLAHLNAFYHFDGGVPTP